MFASQLFALALLFCLVIPNFVQGNSDTEISTKYRYSRGAFITKVDHILPSRSFSSLFVPSLTVCNQKCLLESACVSFNYQLNHEENMLGLCALNSAGVLSECDETLKYKKGYIYTQIYDTHHVPASCLEHSKNGAVQSGLYDVMDSSGKMYQVFCDLTSEFGKAWTLIMSQTFKNHKLQQLRTALFTDDPLSESRPRWDSYRLSLSRMRSLRSVSTHWRVTCNFPTEGVQYRDYARASFAQLDLLNFLGKASCKKMEYMSVRGHSCSGCKAVWYQFMESRKKSVIVHHDSSVNYCQFGSTPGFVDSENNFGYYSLVSRNTNFSCTTEESSSTNHWIGGHTRTTND